MSLKYFSIATLALLLLMIGCAAKGSFSKKVLTSEQKTTLNHLEKAGASKEELDTLSILLKSNAPQAEIQKRIELITQRNLSRLSLGQQRDYYSTGEEERLDYLAAPDKDKWMKRRDVGTIKRLCRTREGKVQYYSLKNLLSKEELIDFVRQDSSGRIEWLKKYWAMHDPTPTTSENEWKGEFDKRVECALESFHSTFGQKPWDDRGDVWIKLGPPESRELSADSSQKGAVERKRGPVLATEYEFYKTGCETWNYVIQGKDVFFQFEDMKFTGHYRLVPRKSANRIENLDYLLNFQFDETRLKMAQAVYHHDYGGKPLDFVWEIIKFRSLNNVYEVLVNTGIPTGKLEKDSTGQVRYSQRIAIRDEKGEIIGADSAKVCQRVPDSKNLLLVDQRGFLLDPGPYSVALEVRDLESKRIGLYKEEIFLPGYVSLDSQIQPGLELSRAILSSRVREAQKDEEESKFFLNGYLVFPNPSHIFLVEQEPEIKAYFEIYNLLPREDTVRFATISQIVKYVSKDSAVVCSDTTVTVHQGFVPGTVAYQIIPLISSSEFYLEPGDYIWRIDVVDLNFPSKTESILNKLRIFKE